MSYSDRANPNRIATHNKNDYFMGVLSAITSQSEVTVNVKYESGEMLARRKNMDRDISRAKSYPGGDNDENLHVLQQELVFGWISRQGRNAVAGEQSGSLCHATTLTKQCYRRQPQPVRFQQPQRHQVGRLLHGPAA